MLVIAAHAAPRRRHFAQRHPWLSSRSRPTRADARAPLGARSSSRRRDATRHRRRARARGSRRAPAAPRRSRRRALSVTGQLGHRRAARGGELASGRERALLRAARARAHECTFRARGRAVRRRSLRRPAPCRPGARRERRRWRGRRETVHAKRDFAGALFAAEALLSIFEMGGIGPPRSGPSSSATLELQRSRPS